MRSKRSVVGSFGFSVYMQAEPERTQRLQGRCSSHLTLDLRQEAQALGMRLFFAAGGESMSVLAGGSISDVLANDHTSSLSTL